MRHLALACSYDQTVASDGRIDPATVAGLRRLVASGRHLILVSRRRVEDLLEVLPEEAVRAVSDLGFLERCECGVAVANAPWPRSRPAATSSRPATATGTGPAATARTGAG